jgi:hypothetical protein
MAIELPGAFFISSQHFFKYSRLAASRGNRPPLNTFKCSVYIKSKSCLDRPGRFFNYQKATSIREQVLLVLASRPIILKRPTCLSWSLN